MADTACVLTIVKKFTYRGQPEEWSNRYMLTGSTPADSTAWRALFDAIVAQEKTVYMSPTTVVAGYGYDKYPETGDNAIWHVDLTVSPNTPVAGTFTGTSNYMAGDQASWIRWGLNRFTNPGGKRIYLRKYFHGGRIDTANPDAILNVYSDALVAFGAYMWGGSIPSSRKICDRFGNIPIGCTVSPYLTTRTLKRRGKRPPTP